MDTSERLKGRSDINVPEVGNNADDEPDNVRGRVSVEIAKGRLDGLGLSDRSVVHRPQQRAPQLRRDFRNVVVVREDVLAKRCENFVPLVVVGTRVKCFDRAPIKKLLALGEPLEVVLYLLELIPGWQQVLVHDLV